MRESRGSDQPAGFGDPWAVAGPHPGRPRAPVAPRVQPSARPIMLSRVASRTASAASRVAHCRPPPPRGRPAGLAVSAADDASGADDGASGEKPAGDETVLGHLLSDEPSTDADDDAPHASADHPDDHPAGPRRVARRDRGSRRRSGRRRRRRGPRRGRPRWVRARRARRGARRVRARAFLGPDPMVRRRGALCRPRRVARPGRRLSPGPSRCSRRSLPALDASSIARFWRLSEDDAARRRRRTPP